MTEKALPQSYYLKDLSMEKSTGSLSSVEVVGDVDLQLAGEG